MHTLVSIDSSTTTTLSYWLNWRVLLCAIWVLGSMLIASILIWKYEYSDDSDSDGVIRRRYCNNRSWKACVKDIHPIFLMLYRLISLCLFLLSLSFDVSIHGAELFYFYTQWTYILVTIYFLIGSLLSIHGCYSLLKKNKYSCDDAEEGLCKSLVHVVDRNGEKLSDSADNKPGFIHICDFVFRALFQMCAGAVTITDVVYWCVMFPFLTIRDYEMSFLTVLTHSLNLVLLLGDTAFNSLQLHWCGISYFILWTGSYVIFEWVIHACVNIWWPYPFLDLSVPNAPLWYLVVAALHVPCYALFLMAVRAKYFILSRWFPQSYQDLS